jgi:hypothetical protein
LIRKGACVKKGRENPALLLCAANSDSCTGETCFRMKRFTHC